MQTVNSRMAIFTKKGKKYAETGKVLMGPVNNNTVFAGFTGACQATNNGDTVVRYDQLADRWLITMPIFRPLPDRPDRPPQWQGDGTVYLAPPGVSGQPGAAVLLTAPPPASTSPSPTPSPSATASPTPSPAVSPTPTGSPAASPAPAGRGRAAGPPPLYAMCYAVSTSSDPLGTWYRYEFLRPLFPDYPRPRSGQTATTRRRVPATK
jgi:hypothetical protein